ncbi:MAG: acyl-CoA thioesterase [Bacteroidales bacterium]|jgi:acyl-CoA thioester hydrolase|nr:acyl-CoA thioesterase [Bacteroidales bacterium]
MENERKKPLTAATEVEVHFYDIDAVQIVWHGHYVKYLENAREAFGIKYGLEYTEIYRQGYIVPVADLHIRYLNTVTLGERLTIAIEYVPANAAKLVFNYRITGQTDGRQVAEATTVQLFMSKDGVFETSTPEFFRRWKKRWKQ